MLFEIKIKIILKLFYIKIFDIIIYDINQYVLTLFFIFNIQKKSKCYIIFFKKIYLINNFKIYILIENDIIDLK